MFTCSISSPRYHQRPVSESKQRGFQSAFFKDQRKTALEFIMRVRRTVHRFPLLLCLMVLMSSFHVGQSMWSLSIPNQVYIVGSVSQFCSGMRELTRRQAIMCEEHRDIMPSIRYGAGIAIRECQYQFKYRLWNCSVPERDSNTLFNRITGKDTREAAFTYAISSAGVVHSIARACVEGNLSMCGCSRERRPKNLKSEYQWGGCGDNIEFGAKFARKFIAAGEDPQGEEQGTKHQERKLMNLHNNEVGIQVVKENSKIRCRCHGVSKSCEIQSCWRELRDFREIGGILHDSYDNAMRVRFDRRKGRIEIMDRRSENGYRRPGKRRNAASGKVPIERLVYLNPSPDYCVKSNKRETLGTVGRVCKKDSEGYDSCESLCCGRGFSEIEVIITERCKCKFHWCCTVKCKECTRPERIHICH